MCHVMFVTFFVHVNRMKEEYCDSELQILWFYIVKEGVNVFMLAILDILTYVSAFLQIHVVKRKM